MPLQHTAAYADFANGGNTTRPYGILGDGTIRGRPDLQPRPRRAARRCGRSRRWPGDEPDDVPGGGDQRQRPRRAALDFTIGGRQDRHQLELSRCLVVGSPGRWRRRWVGYDDSRPMPGITGGSLPTQAWHSYMQVGTQELPDHSADPGDRPASLKPGCRSAAASSELKRTDPGMAQAQLAQAAQKPNSIMPDQTRIALKKVAETMRQAAGLQPTPASAAPAGATPPGAPGAPGSRPLQPKAKPPAAVPDRRAEVPGVGERPRP